MKPLDFYRLGLDVADNADNEPQQRMAVGRLYYGLHHEACCRFFRENVNSPPLGRGSRHIQLQTRFNSSDDPRSKHVAQLLNDLRLLRVQADYEIVPPFTVGTIPLSGKQFLVLAVRRAHWLLVALENYSPGEAEDGCRCPVA